VFCKFSTPAIRSRQAWRLLLLASTDFADKNMLYAAPESSRRCMKSMGELYKHPEEYDLEHLGDSDDIDFYVSLARKLKPRRILELGCGTGRITLPLAEEGARLGSEVVGLDSQSEMLDKAANRRLQAPPEVRERLALIEADMRVWRADSPFDLVVTPCSSVTHLLSLQDQLTVWKLCRSNLAQNGRFVVEVMMPNMAVFADSFQVPVRTPVEVDIDKFDESDGIRLIRRKTTHYLSDDQRAQTRFLYEKYKDGRAIEQYIDDFAGHVYFPRELELLFIHSGFKVEHTFGDFRRRPLQPNSPLIIMIGKRA
jgi:SAM-dependent methyltransferase